MILRRRDFAVICILIEVCTFVIAVPRCNLKIPFFDKCNVCACAEDGKSMSCTKMPCDWCEYNEVGTCIRKVYKGDRIFYGRVKCQPYKTFQRHCNTCVCDYTGRSAICTNNFCGFEDYSEYFSNFRCLSGQMYRKDCNACICDSTGFHGICTQNKCVAWEFK